MDRDRNCPEWYPYTPGFSPKELLEELRMMELESARQDQEREMARLEAKVQADSLKIAEATQAITETAHRFTTKWTRLAFAVAIFALLIAAVGVAFTVLAYVHPAAPASLPTPTPIASAPIPHGR